jgi:hypothetical protein
MAINNLGAILTGLVKEGRLEEARNGPIHLYRLPGRPHYFSKEQIETLLQSNNEAEDR